VPSFSPALAIAAPAGLPENPCILLEKFTPMSQSVFFAHANGFPSATYGALFSALGAEYPVQCLAQHGHDPRFPVADNWERLVDELIYHLQQQRAPVIGVGHSLGGVLHYHAALRHPELYRGVVMLDSPVLTLLDKWVIRAAKRFGFIDKITPAGRTLGRCETFTDRDSARRYFSAKSLFRRFDPLCLEDYLQHGLKPAGEGLSLAFAAQTEINIYRSIPHTSPGRPEQLQVPLAMIRGRHSQVVLPHHTWSLRRVASAESLTLPGGHMFPLERPQATADLLKQIFTRWAQQQALV
jgi:pimeloyl-ACP methyl ester carboxylesterase